MTESAPRELAAWMILLRAPAAPFVPAAWHGELVCAMSVCYSGDLDAVDDVLAPIQALGEPAFDLLAEQPYTAVQSVLDGSEPKGDHYYWRTEFVAALDDELLATVRELAAECPIPRAQIGLLHLGGALNERADDDGAVGNRDARYACGVIGAWDPDEPDEDAFRDWVRAAGERCRRFSTRQLHQLPERRRGRGSDPRVLRRQFRTPRGAQGAVRPGEPLPVEPQHRSRGRRGA